MGMTAVDVLVVAGPLGRAGMEHFGLMPKLADYGRGNNIIDLRDQGMEEFMQILSERNYADAHHRRRGASE